MSHKLSSAKPQASVPEGLTTLQQLAQQAQALWHCQTSQELLASLSLMAARDAGARRLSIVNVTGPVRDWQWEECPPLADAPVPPLAHHELGMVAAGFKAVQGHWPAPTVFYGEGALHGYLAFALGDSGGERYLFAAQADVTLMISGSETRAAWDFLIMQAQETFRWMMRHERTRALVHRDDLTGLYNYRFLDSSLDSEMRRVQRFQTSFCLLFIDLDNFKPINDEHGHLAGSSVLKQVADVLKDTLREVDTVFRYGGDEYVVLLLEANSTTGAMAAERIRARIENHHFRIDDSKFVRLSCSIGVAACPEHGTDKESLLATADASMYKSKKGGKNRVTIAPEQAASARERTVLVGVHR